MININPLMVPQASLIHSPNYLGDSLSFDDPPFFDSLFFEKTLSKHLHRCFICLVLLSQLILSLWKFHQCNVRKGVDVSRQPDMKSHRTKLDFLFSFGMMYSVFYLFCIVRNWYKEMMISLHGCRVLVLDLCL